MAAYTPSCDWMEVNQLNQFRWSWLTVSSFGTCPRALSYSFDLSIFECLYTYV